MGVCSILENEYKHGGVLHFFCIVYVEKEEGDKNPEKFICGHSSIPEAENNMIQRI